MNEEKKYEIGINIRTTYLPDQSDEEADRYVFAYTITIANIGNVTAQLISRAWVIMNGDGTTQEVRGLGVVGEQPLLKPGDSFEYTSGTVISSPTDIAWVMPQLVQQHVGAIQHFVVEHPKTARQFLKKINSQYALQSLQLQELNEHTHDKDLQNLLEPLLAGHDVGLLSEAGCPAIADPGAGLIRLAHQHNIMVIPFVGPSSISMALMASGLNGQCFAFHGYLPIESNKQIEKILFLEKLSIQQDQTQIFIETPYRNQKLLERHSYVLLVISPLPMKRLPPKQFGNGVLRHHPIFIKSRVFSCCMVKTVTK